MTMVEKSSLNRAARAAKRENSTKDNGRGIYVAILVLMVIIALFQLGIFGNTLPKECGSCGAIVHNTWSVRNMDDTAFVDVCEHCYIDIVDGGEVYEMNA